MTKRMYTVNYDVDVLVIATSKEEAVKVANTHVMEELENTGMHTSVRISRPIESWTDDGIPYGDNVDDRDVGWWLTKNAEGGDPGDPA